VGIMMLSHTRHLTILALALPSPWSVRACEIGTGRAFFRSNKNSDEGFAGNLNPIVHTRPAFNPTAHTKLPHNKTA
jgi:hypothetical protein